MLSTTKGVLSSLYDMSSTNYERNAALAWAILVSIFARFCRNCWQVLVGIQGRFLTAWRSRRDGAATASRGLDTR